MEKLIELLTEHCRKHYWFKDNDDIEIDTDSVCFHLYHKWKRYFPIRIETVICKDFGFIDWLVENEKIDKDKVKLLSVFQETWYYNLYQSLLMILAIQENPIEFLCSVLI